MPEWAMHSLASLERGFAALHFLRPYWLGGLAFAVMLYGVLWYRQDARRQWQKFVAPHLLDHLLVRPARRSTPGPRVWLCGTLALASLAMAGPAWQRQPSPFVSELAPLVIALHLGASMDATDVQPSRLLRAEQKLRELLQLRRGARTALIVFAASAHRVLPLTDDAKLLSAYIAALRTDVLPTQPGGKAALAEAVNLATEMLAADGTSGSVVLVTDNVSVPPDSALLPSAVILWTFGAAKEVASLADRQAWPWIEAGTGDADVHEVNFRIQSQLESTLAEKDAGHWQDEGALFLWPLLMLVALGFRRGWVVRWR